MYHIGHHLNRHHRRVQVGRMSGETAALIFRPMTRQRIPTARTLWSTGDSIMLANGLNPTYRERIATTRGWTNVDYSIFGTQLVGYMDQWYADPGGRLML